MQYELDFQEEDARRRSLERKWMKLMREVVEDRGLSYVAGKLDIAPSKLKHALSGTQRNPPRMDWVPTIVRLARNNRPVQFLAELIGEESIPKAPPDPERENLAWREAIAELPDGQRRAFEERVADLVRRRIA